MGRARSHTRRRPRANPRGVLSVRAGGFGFVQTAEGVFFIPASKMSGAFDGDLVELVPLPAQGSRAGRARGRDGSVGGRDGVGGSPAARVLRVLERAHDTLVGRYEVADPFGVVVPEDPRIPYDVFTMRADNPDIEDGSLVRVRIATFPSRNVAATGVVEEVLGRADGAHAAVDAVVARHKLETAFSEGALDEARSASLDEDGALADGYRDLRERFTFTVDPDDARDFDDAVSLDAVALEGGEASGVFAVGSDPEKASVLSDASRRPTRGGEAPFGVRFVEGRSPASARWRLGVHIADVSHYVAWGSSLDLDARRRATSVYLVDRVIPMLPEELSGDLCSLRPGMTRRAMTVDLYLDEAARLVGYELYPSLIRSDVRLTYDEVGRALVGADPVEAFRAARLRGVGCTGRAGLEEGLAWRLRELSRIAKARQATRERAGGLDFDTVEARVRLDAEGRPEGVDLRCKTDATALVEEAMILANETVAAHLRDAGFPGLYRVHERPASDGLAALAEALEEFPWFSDVDARSFAAGEAHALQRALAASAGRPEGELVSSLLLRSMKRAVYRPECEPHYGLASDAYAHFTSPIRRYPDLVVHRMLKALLGGRPEHFDQEAAALPWIAEHSSEMERVAERAARESQELKLVEYLEGFVGQAFSAVVSGVAPGGFYVRLDNTAEGFVPLRVLGDEYFELDAVQHRLTGQDSGTSYRLGQRLAVVLTNADARSCRLDFRLASPRWEAC
ncbi:3'-5' exonuclease [Gordonibacter sp. An230]|uniref:ribonuclease R family protein n=1 Tax=Gordonibacter sp. An230 TaxID=1965592 RepID=UPI000B3907C6|nr:VacB/RNase II family 3'-5' exoribonuclease [Gordonibacter sp. An230]OUO90472.1 3'-5' exonuclease [Gordonibacter sp. An230]